jgi:GT2 family glycosyltransferase
MNITPELSVIIISFNTKEILRQCLSILKSEIEGLSCEIIVVDNASKDGSEIMVQEKYPWVNLVKSAINLGFGKANNVGFREAKGKFIVLLNSDAFLNKGTLKLALEKIKSNSKVGLAGGRLVGQDGSWQPSARLFPSLLNETLGMTGLSQKYKKSSFFGRYDRTWDPPENAAEADWVPGAFCIIPKKVLDEVGGFDERFFLYYEEVDLCRRIKNAGYDIWYWPDIVVVHLGGESAKSVKALSVSSASKQLALWSYRSAFMYYRKHHGYWGAFAFKKLHSGLFGIKAFKNSFGNDAESVAKTKECSTNLLVIEQAWEDTKAGTYCPETPW